MANTVHFSFPDASVFEIGKPVIMDGKKIGEVVKIDLENNSIECSVTDEELIAKLKGDYPTAPVGMSFMGGKDA